MEFSFELEKTSILGSLDILAEGHAHILETNHKSLLIAKVSSFYPKMVVIQDGGDVRGIIGQWQTTQACQIGELIEYIAY